MRAGGGRPRIGLRALLRAIRHEGAESVKVLQDIRDDQSAAKEDRIRAAVALLNLTGLTRLKPKQGRRSQISVVRRTPKEMTRAADPTEPEPGPGIRR